MPKNPDNIIQLSNGRRRIPANPVQEAKENPEEVLEKIKANRASGLQALENKVDGFDLEKKVPFEAHVEDRFRDHERGLKGTFTNLESLNALVDMIQHDLIGILQNMEQNAVAQFQSSAHLQVLLSILKEKGVITETEMEETWQELIVKPATDPKAQK